METAVAPKTLEYWIRKLAKDPRNASRNAYFWQNLAVVGWFFSSELRPFTGMLILTDRVHATF